MGANTETLYVVIDPSKAQSGSQSTVNAINAIIQAAIQLNVQINNTTNNIGNLGGRGNTQKLSGLKSAIQALTNDFGRLGALVAIAQPVRLFHAFIDEIAKVDRAYNGFIAMMNVTTNDLKASGEEFKYVKQMANAYGVEIENLLKSYSRLRASTTGIMSKDETQRLFQSMTAVSSVLHAESYAVERMFNALIQMASKGKVHMEELKQQLGEHLPGALAIAASAMKMSMGDMIDAMKRGEISARQLLIPLPDELMKRFGPASEIAAASLTSQINRLKNIWFEMFASMSNNGISNGLAGIVKAVSDQLDPASAGFKEFSQVVGNAMLDVADFIRNLKPQDLKKFGSDVIDVVKGLIWFSSVMVDVMKLLVHFRSEVALLGAAWVTYRVYALAAAVASIPVAAGFTMIRTAASGMFSLLAAGIGGYSLGTYLVNEFDVVKRGAIALVAGLHKLTISVTGSFHILAIKIPLFFAEAFEGAVNSVHKFYNYIKSFGSEFLGFLGLENVKDEFKLDLTSGLKTDLNSVVSQYQSQMSEVDGIYAAMFDEVDNSKNVETDVLTRMGLSSNALADAKAYFESLKSAGAEAEHLLGNGKKSGEGTAAAFREAVNAAKSFKDVYDIVVQDIKTALEFGDISPTQAFEKQITELTKYSALAKSSIEKAMSDPSMGAKQRAKLYSEAMKLDKDYQIELRTLQRDMMKEREDYLLKLESAEIASNSRRLSRLDKFMMDWRDGSGKLMERAQLEKDTETMDRLMRMFNAEKARVTYQADDASGYTPEAASSDMVKDNADIFKGSSRQIDAVLAKYQGFYKQLDDLRSSDSLRQEEFAQLAIQLETAKNREIFDAAVRSAQERLELGTGTFADAITSSFGRIVEGFTTMNAGVTDLMGSFFQDWTDGFANSFGRAIVYAEDLNEALLNVARESLASLISGLVKLGIQWVLNAAIGSQIQATAAATSQAITMAQASAAATAWAPAAALASLATSGANAAPAMAGMSAASIMSSAIAATSKFAGAFDLGGEIPTGQWGIVGEYGPEIIQGPANVTSRVDTAKMLQYNKDLPENDTALADKIVSAIQSVNNQPPQVNLKSVNVIDPNLLDSYLSTDDGERLIMNIVQRNSPVTT